MDDGIQWDAPVPDFIADAEETLKRLEEEAMDTTEDDVKPDHRTRISEGYSCLFDA